MLCRWADERFLPIERTANALKHGRPILHVFLNSILFAGDSGGPIQFRTRFNQEDIFTIVGVTSFGASCGSSIPGVYTRVSKYLDWVEKVVWPENVAI